MSLMAQTATTATATTLWVSKVDLNKRQKAFRNENYAFTTTLSKKPSSRTHLLSSSRVDICCITISTSSSHNRSITREQPTCNHNLEICKFCEVGNLQKAMELFSKCEKFDLDVKTFCSLLQLCAELKSIENGRKVHTFITNNGIAIDGFLGSKLVFMYVTCGDLKQGRRVFDEVANEKVFLWNMLINEYAKIGEFKEGVDLYYRMLVFGVEPNSYTFSCVLKCFGALGSVLAGEKVHGCLLKLGFGSYNTVVNSLIAFYFKCGRVESGVKLFDELSDRDVISWNSMISGYVANGLAEKGLEIFIEMLSFGVNVDLVTMVSVLPACVDFGGLVVCRAIHGYAIKTGFDKKITFENTLLDVYSKCGDLDGAIRVFENMAEKSIVSWTSMIAGYVREAQSGKALVLFHEMIREGIKPDVFTITSILHACACNCSLEDGKEVHEYIRKNNMESSLYVSNALMDMYAKCGSMKNAHSVFSRMSLKDIVSWNTMIGGYSKNSLPNEALSLFVEMQHHIKPDDVTMTCILPSCASLAALDKGREIHGYILRHRLSSDRFVANALVDVYAKCGVLVIARILFDTITTKDLVSWTIMIAGYGMHGLGSEAIATFNEMRQARVEPDEVSFVSILYACSHSGLLDEGWRFFNVMRNEYKIEPNLEHYACMVDLLSRAGKLAEAYKFIKTIPIKPDATVWGVLLCGCRIHHDVKLAEKVAEHVFELEPENTGYYVLLANIYAEAEKGQEVKRLHDKIGQRGLKKNRACSWIEVKGKVHIFVSGDNAHPQAKKIESLLKNLRKKMEEQGSFPKLKYALINADEREKEMALCGHSEKLAMAFGILRLPPGKTLRVTKNLRVCGDCHETAKFISKSLGREIILRDSNRFHHFKDGSCSCRGYW